MRLMVWVTARPAVEPRCSRLALVRGHPRICFPLDYVICPAKIGVQSDGV
jgi:hypothetical protein